MDTMKVAKVGTIAAAALTSTTGLAAAKTLRHIKARAQGYRMRHHITAQLDNVMGDITNRIHHVQDAFANTAADVASHVHHVTDNAPQAVMDTVTHVAPHAPTAIKVALQTMGLH
jgi:hypothetical protein